MPSFLDAIVLVVLLVSALLAMMRGFVREALTLVSWAAAAAAAYLLYKVPLPLVKSFLDNPTAAIIVSAAAIFLIALIVVSFASMKIADFVLDSRVGAVDRGLGFLYGAGRGLLLMVVAQAFFLWLAQTTPGWMANAKSKPILQSLGNQLMEALPQDLEASLKRLFGSRGSSGGDAGQAPDESPPDAVPGPSDASRQELNRLIENGGN
jgi:membrane protein required for colicin V production